MKKNGMTNKRKFHPQIEKLICLVLFTLMMTDGMAVNPTQKNEPDYQVGKKYAFPKSKPNIITDPSGSLNPFLTQLNELEEKTRSLLTITHIGDSHIQADFETGMVRKLLQERFGNAGRGLVVPLKLAKTNEPLSYRITSSQEWTAVRCIKPGPVPFGIGGMALQYTDVLADISIRLTEDSSLNIPAFNECTVFYDTETSEIVLPDSSTVTRRKKLNRYAEQFILKDPQSSFDFGFYSPDQKNILFYGALLKNGRPGIIYNAIGINGAHYFEYAAGSLFIEQLSSLQTDLFIFSMGINEAYDKNFTADKFYQQIDSLIQQVRANNPQAVFLLTTPAESWKKSGKQRIPHPSIEIARNTIVKYAEDHQMAYWDLFAITGGKGSARSWTKNALFSRDGVHFTKEGYEYQGELLGEAVFKLKIKN